MKFEYGKVYLVGAGPGDPGLITVKAMEKLKQADVVVYDRLINNDLLSYCKKECEKIFVGKESGYHPIEQEHIAEILINKSKLGHNVVRLKGGNPFVFGRGSEEAIALNKADIDFEIIPGITSGLSVPIYSGIPITQRGLITQCVLITAHECPEKPETQVDWKRLAKLKNSALVIYMGASRIEKISNELIKYGMDPAMPVAVIENGTLPKQRTITAKLDKIAMEFKKKNFHAPAIILISPTVALREKVSWYEKKLLFNKRVVLVGSNRYSKELYNMLYDLGGEILLFPIDETLVRFPEIGLRKSSNGVHLGVTSTRIKVDVDNSLSIKKDFSYDILLQELNECRIETPEQEALYSFPSKSSEIELIDDIEKNGADLFIFTSPSAVENFFNVLGFETSVEVLKRGISLAVNQTTANALIRRDIINIKVTDNNTVKTICDSICGLFDHKNK